MKSLKCHFITAALLACLFAIVSCKKDKDAVPESPVVGTWQGAVTENNKPANLKMDIKNDGTVTVTAQSIEFSGTWILNANIFEAKFLVDGVKAIAKGELSADKKMIKGKWGEDNNGKYSSRDLELNKD